MIAAHWRADQNLVTWCTLPCTACHPLHGDGLDIHVFERVDEWEAGLSGVSGEAQAVRLEGLQLLELDENGDLGAYLIIYSIGPLDGVGGLGA